VQDCKIKNIYVNMFRKGEEDWYTLRKGEIEEDTQRRNFEHQKRGIIETSKVRAGMIIANTPPRDITFLSHPWFSELSRLPNWGNLDRTANSFVEEMIA